MTDMTMTCERVDELLAAWIEGDLDREAREAVGGHLRQCLRCAAIVRDLNAIRREAARLPGLEPSRDLWAGIAARIEAPVVDVGSHRAPARRRLAWGLAAAATLLVAVTSGITWTLARRDADSSVAGAGDSVPAAGSPVATVAGVRPLTPELVYDREINELRAVLDQRRSLLDSATVAAVEQSIRIIDTAIAEARAALARDASSAFLHDQLNRALQKKVGVLRTVALLPAGAS